MLLILRVRRTPRLSGFKTPLPRCCHDARMPI
jgi:hypothetical protein